MQNMGFVSKKNKFPNIAEKMYWLVLDLVNDLVETKEVSDPQNTLSTLESFGMDWCFCILYSMRNALAKQYVASIEDGVCLEYKNCTDIDDFCEVLIAKTRAAEQLNKQHIDWKKLVMFCGRFASIRADDDCQDIVFKHWHIDDTENVILSVYYTEISKEREEFNCFCYLLCL